MSHECLVLPSPRIPAAVPVCGVVSLCLLVGLRLSGSCLDVTDGQGEGGGGVAS